LIGQILSVYIALGGGALLLLLLLLVARLGCCWSLHLLPDAAVTYGTLLNQPRMHGALLWFAAWFVATAAGLIVLFHNLPTVLAVWLVWLVTLGLLGLIDARTGLLPNELTLLLLVSGLLWHAFDTDGWLPPPAFTWGAVLGYCAPKTLNAVHQCCTGRLVIGEGDAKFLAGLGAWLGLHALPLVWVIACVAVLVYTAVMWVAGHQRSSYVTFGPFLATGASGAVFLNHVS